jgi:hypothetical protein
VVCKRDFTRALQPDDGVMVSPEEEVETVPPRAKPAVQPSRQKRFEKRLALRQVGCQSAALEMLTAKVIGQVSCRTASLAHFKRRPGAAVRVGRPHRPR